MKVWNVAGVIALLLSYLLLIQIWSDTRRIRIVLERAWPSNEQIETIESSYWRGFNDGKKER